MFADSEDVGGPERKMDRLGVLKSVGWVGAAALELSVPDVVKYDDEGGELRPWDAKAEDKLCRLCAGLASPERGFSIAGAGDGSWTVGAALTDRPSLAHISGEAAGNALYQLSFLRA